MSTVFRQPDRLRAWNEATQGKTRGEPVDWESVLGGFQATVDWPGCAFWRELIAAYPEAKVVLTLRDPDRWYDSAATTIYRMTGPDAEMSSLVQFDTLPAEVVAHLNATVAFVDALLWQDTFGGRFADRNHAIRIFNEHNEAVRSAVPPERLLVYEVKEGWTPLCRFLGVAEPADEPFPHVNDSVSFLAARTAPEAFRQRLAELLGP